MPNETLEVGAAIQAAAPKLAYPFVKGMREQLGFGRTAAFDALKNGLIRTYMIGRKRFVSHAALQEFVAKMDDEQRAEDAKAAARGVA